MRLIPNGEKPTLEIDEGIVVFYAKTDAGYIVFAAPKEITCPDLGKSEIIVFVFDDKLKTEDIIPIREGWNDKSGGVYFLRYEASTKGGSKDKDFFFSCRKNAKTKPYACSLAEITEVYTDTI